jgi:hypothetical protein
MSITFSKWRHKPGRNPRYSVYDGQNRLGDIFEARGIFSAVTADGNLIIASTSVEIAANALMATGLSS